MKNFIYVLIILISTAHAATTLSCRIKNSSQNQISYELFKSTQNTPCLTQVISENHGSILPQKNKNIFMKKSDKPICIIIDNSIVAQFVQNELCQLTFTNTNKLLMNEMCQKNQEP